jgi:hypothetical protein
MKTSISAFRKTVALPCHCETNDTMEYYVGEYSKFRCMEYILIIINIAVTPTEIASCPIPETI